MQLNSNGYDIVKSDNESFIPPRVVVVGGGFSGVVFSVQLARKTKMPVAIDVVEPRALLGAGLAYSTSDPSHRINVPASKMSVFADQPGHFEDWLRRGDELAHDAGAWSWPGGQAYPRRAVFGRYVASLVEETNQCHQNRRIAHIRDRVIAAECHGDRYRLRFKSGAQRSADLLVLATGHPLPVVPALLTAALGDDPRIIRDPWQDGALDGIQKCGAVLVIGTALTMADAVASLDRVGHIGTITAFSRRGLLPRGHAAAALLPFDHFKSTKSPDAALDLLRLVRHGVSVAERDGLPWQAAFDDLRSNASRLWQALPLVEQRRFLRHCRSYWDVHRYRVAPQVEAVIERKRSNGSLEVQAASLKAVQQHNDRIQVTLRPRASAANAEIHRVVDAIVVAAGPAHASIIEHNAALGALARQGHIRADPNQLGLDVDRLSRAIGIDGEANPTLLVAGPLARGRFGELMGLPQVSEHAEAVASLAAGWLDANFAT
jgi:uncharacterized NAD(P)/FAD-binding protein YdhS